MENEITSDWIDRYNEDELSEAEKSIFQKRMLSNPLLRSEVYIDAQLNRFLADVELLDLMSKIRSASRRNTKGFRPMNILLIAASVLCFVMIAGLFYMVRTNMETSALYTVRHQNQFIQTDVNETVKQPCPSKFEQHGHGVSLPFIVAIHQGLLAKNFEPLPEFELLIGSVTRSHQFKLISPNVNDTIFSGAEVHFAWQDYDQTVPISIILMNNHGLTVSEMSLNHASSYDLKTNGFQEGLYYWKIMMDDDMVLMGKLTII